MLGLAFLKVYPGELTFPAVGTSIGLIMAGGVVIVIGEVKKKKSVDIYNTSIP